MPTVSIRCECDQEKSDKNEAEELVTTRTENKCRHHFLSSNFAAGHHKEELLLIKLLGADAKASNIISAFSYRLLND